MNNHKCFHVSKPLWLYQHKIMCLLSANISQTINLSGSSFILASYLERSQLQLTKDLRYFLAISSTSCWC